MLDQSKLELLQLLEEKDRRQRYNRLGLIFPDTGPRSRDLYPKHIEFMKLGATTAIRIFMAANQIGKSTTGCVELTYHLTGQYPDWWEGKRFDTPIRAWAASDTQQTVRDNLQRHLVGDEIEGYGTGFIPADCIGQLAKKSAPAGALDFVKVKHTSGGWSTLVFKSYDQRRPKFQADQIHVVLLDEEPDDIGIYSECVTRTAATDGIVMMTFTSLKGITLLVMKFMPEFAGVDVNEIAKDEFGVEEIDDSSRAVVVCGWDDVPHLDEKTKAKLKAEYSEAELDARTKGIPSVGQGQIYPFKEETFVIDPIPIAPHWKRVAGLDPGGSKNDPSKKTAAIWAAWDEENDIVYFYSEHYQPMADVAVHAAAMRARGVWIPFVSDDSTDVEGNTTVGKYAKAGLLIKKAQKSEKRARILDLHNRFATGRVKVFKTLPNFLMEFRLYRSNEAGKITSQRDHIMNAAEYVIQSGLKVARLPRPESSGPVHGEQTFGLFS